MYYVGNIACVETDIQHFGIPGMKWGQRRYQNSDGTLTEEGKQRYGSSQGESRLRKGLRVAGKAAKTLAKTAAVAGAVTTGLGLLNLGSMSTGGAFTQLARDHGMRAANTLIYGKNNILSDNTIGAVSATKMIATTAFRLGLETLGLKGR